MNWSKMGLIILLSLSGLVACNKNEGGNSSRAPVGGNPANFNMTTGSVTGSYNVTSDVQNFLATNTFDINQIQQVNQTSGIQFSGVVRFDNNNNLIANQSYINIRINFTDTNNMQQSTIVGIQGTSGNVSYSGYVDARAQIRFEDQYGYVVMDGSFNRTEFRGSMYFYNKATNAQGNLGEFRVTTCGFFYCVQ